MINISVSIVIFQSDLEMLAEAIKALRASCLHAALSIPIRCTLDLVNNKVGDIENDKISALARGFSNSLFSIELICAPYNGGYGAGNNISLSRNTASDFHLVLNPDVLISERSILNALTYMASNLDIGLLTPQVRGFDGTLHRLCKQHPTLLDMLIRSAGSDLIRMLFRERIIRYEMQNRDYSKLIRPVPYPTGCFMFFRRLILTQIGGFDEGYFLHYEDADMGRKVSIISETAYVPDVTVLHKWSRDSHKSWHMRWVTIKSGLRYWRKWGGVW